MKKLFIAAMAVAALASCAQEEFISYDNKAIEFGDAFVNNSTKAIYEGAEDITGFTVWGNVKGEGVSTPVALYGDTGATVERKGAALGAAWSCSEIRFWTPVCNYNFVAIANGTAAEVVNGVPTKIAYTVNTAEPADLIYGATTAATDVNCTPTPGAVVNFTMQHLLSRIKLSFLNSVAGGDYTYEITDVTVTTWEKGIHTIGATTPWAQNGSTSAVLNFNGVDNLGNSATATLVGDKLVIPGSAVTLAFTYNEKLNGTTFRTATVTKMAVVVPVQNYSYNITVEFSKENQIKFTINSVNGLGGFTDNPGVNIQ